MYATIKSCISINGEQSDFFQCYRGLRQGENVSPILFSLYLNDLENFMTTNISPTLDINNANLETLLKLSVLLYADDTVVFAKSEENLIQATVNSTVPGQ